jgi:hypothetical protein
MPTFPYRVQFQPKANIPMVGETRDRLALEIRMAGESLIGHPSIDAYNTLSKMFAALERAGMSSILVHPGSRLMGMICDRYEQSGGITVDACEAKGLRQVLAAIDAGLHRIPLQRFVQAVAEVEVFFNVVNPTDAGELA